MPLRVAIVGSGVSGLAALWALNQSAENEVHIFEAQDYIGGHVQTVYWQTQRGDKRKKSIPVNLAFSLFNEATYPNFAAFLSHLNIKAVPLRISFGITRNNGDFEWSSSSISAILAQRGRIFSASMWRMLFDIVRFNNFSTDILESDCAHRGDSIGTYLHRNNYSKAFIENYLIPLSSALWVSNPVETFTSNPAVMIVRYFWNHHMLNTFKDQLSWSMIEGGAKRYIDAILAETPSERVHTSATVMGLRNDKGKVVLLFEDGKMEIFDRVILATHAPQALSILGPHCSPEERQILGCFRTTDSTVVLHSDLSFMPRNRIAWSAWNYLDDGSSATTASKKASLTFNLTGLSGYNDDEDGHILTTLNPSRPPDSAKVQGTYNYSHPFYDSNVLAKQEQMYTIQGKRNVWFAGAWMKYGFHEDGFTAGLEAAKAISPGIQLPFSIVDSKYSRGMCTGRLSWETQVLRFLIAAIQFLIISVTAAQGQFSKIWALLLVHFIRRDTQQGTI